MTDPVDRLSELSAPRPLSPDLRARLEDALLVPVSRPLSEAQEESLTEALRDPVGERLAGLDAPRALPVALRAQLQQDLVRRKRWQPLAAAAAVAAAVVGIVVALPDRGTAPPPTAIPTADPTALVGSGGLAGSGSSGGGTTGGAGTTGTTGAVRGTPRPLPPVAAPAAPAPVVVGAPQGAAPRPSPTPTPSPRQPQPTVTALDPTSGPPGTWVTLTGTALGRTTKVTFGGVVATELEQVSATAVRARAPQHLPGRVDVVLTTPSGSSAPQRYLFL